MWRGGWLMRDAGMAVSEWVVGLSAGDAALLLVAGVGVVFGGVALGEVWRRITR